MNKVFLLCILGAVLLLQTKGIGQPAKTKITARWIDERMQKADEQYKYLATKVPPGVMPRSFTNDTLRTCTSENWVAGFYPGTLLYLYENTKDKAMYDEAMKKITLMDNQQNSTNTHDLGFMMYCSYGNLNRLAPNEKYRQILINAARGLATRFNPKVGCIRSWGKIDDTSMFRVIIDNMMNLELLTYATKVTGDSSFYNIAVTHAKTTMKNHFRPDYSSYHVVEYSEKTGAVTKKRTQQGANDSSAWARGQSWALYGYTVMYRETRNEKYLEQANGIASYMLSHPNLPADKIPYWDFNAPGMPNTPRDASAGAVTASALLELSTYNKGRQAVTFFGAAEQMLTALAGKNYLSPYGKNKGFLLEHSVGSLPQQSEVDVPLTYADYYFVEGLLRYKALSTGKSFDDIVFNGRIQRHQGTMKRVVPQLITASPKAALDK